MTEFTVHKITPRHPDPVKRILCLTETTVLERDPQTYSVCTLRPLCEVFALVRDKDNLQKFCIEYKNGVVRSYTTNDRDSLLATLLDAVRSSGNQDVHIQIVKTPRGKRYVPLSSCVDEETEANLLRLVINNFQNPAKRQEVLERFNANIPHSGLNYSVTQDVCMIKYHNDMGLIFLLHSTEPICREQREANTQCFTSIGSKRS